jgi:hypothetical protein
MLKLVSRMGLVAAAVSVFPGCLEFALIKALEEDAPDDTYEDDYYYEDDTYADETYWDDTYSEEDWDDTEYEDTYANPSALDIRSASLAGDMGSIRGFADEQPSYLGYDYGSYASVEVHAQAPDGAVMAILQIEGGLDNPELAPGAHLQFRNYEYTDSGLYIYVIGCSGPVEGNWVFDESAGDLVVDVSVTPEGTTVLDFVATFSDGQTVVGSTELGALQAQ